MEFTIKKLTDHVVDVKYIEARFTHEDEGDENVNSLPFIDNMEVNLLIDIETGQIQNYPTGLESIEFFAKVVDDGTYTLYDKDMIQIHRVEDVYVPNNIIPPKHGFGDCISLKINENGVIKNWYQKDEISIKELFENPW